MKVLAIVLLCAFAAVQGRSAPVANTNALATVGENPWIVHLRFAVATSGFLSTCAGSLISDEWVLTASDGVTDSRFIWIRLGAIEVIKPELVFETSNPRVNNDLALIKLSRSVPSTNSIAPVSLNGGDYTTVSNFCGFGGDDNVPGEQLTCYDVSVEKFDDKIVASSESDFASKFDIGAALVGDQVQVGVLVEANGNIGTFVTFAGYEEWIEEETGLVITPKEPESESSESSDSESSEEDALKVHFVN